MFRNQKLELKVGLFMGMAIFLMFLIVFSISDFYLLKKGYGVKVVFDYVNGIGVDAPVRLAGVHVGEVKDIELYYDDNAGRTRVKLDIWVSENARIEEDAVARINTLGLLGEQYLEVSPGTAKRFLKPGDMIVGRTPVNIGRQMEEMSELVESFAGVMQHVERGEGTLGRLLVDETLYNDLSTIFGRLSKGEGTIGKLLVEEKVYDDLEGFVSDIKAHPWKLLRKTSGDKRKSRKK
ncbi:MAG: hypothetical protein DRP85_03500 [Candidatus Makaraimicrobium thalassicum]|nr:MAG: hypothetical protein DRP85_03500 [Candidatus Omnitrophota bacterium]